MAIAQFLGVIRHILTAAGATLIANGTFSADQWDQIVGVVITLASIGWSVWQKTTVKAKPGMVPDPMMKPQTFGRK